MHPHITFLLRHGLLRLSLPIAAGLAVSIALVSYLVHGAEALSIRAFVAELGIALVITVPLALLHGQRRWQTLAGQDRIRKGTA
jgi:hypothetical protein